MSTDDIDINFFHETDRSEENLNGWTTIGNEYTEYSSNKALYYTSVGGKYKTVFKGIPEGEDWMAGMIDSSSYNPSDNNTTIAGFVKLNDGYYYLFGMRSGTRAGFDQYLIPGFKKQLTRPTIGDALSLTTYDGSIQGDDFWGMVKLIFRTDGTVDLVANGTYTDIETVRIVIDPVGEISYWPSDPINAQTYEQEVATWEGTEIVEIGYIGYSNFTITGMYVNAIPPISIGGTANIENVISTSVVKNIGGGGGGTIIAGFNRDDTDAIAVIESNLRKSYIIRDTTYGNYMFKGEITTYSLGVDTVIYRLEETIKKLVKQMANTNPVLFKSEIMNIQESIVVGDLVDVYIRDEFAGWTIDAFVDKLLITKDNDYYLHRINPIKVVPYVANNDGTIIYDYSPPTNESGSVTYLYWYVPEHDRDVYGIHYDNNLVQPYQFLSPIMEFDFYQYAKNNVQWDKATMKLIVRFTSLQGLKVFGIADEAFPQILIYNYTTASWDLVYQYLKDNHSDANVENDEEWWTWAIEDADGSAGKSPIFDDEFELLSLLGVSAAQFDTDYMYYQQANDNGFRRGVCNIRVKGCGVPNSSYDPKMEVHYLHLEFEETDGVKISQAQEESASYIVSNTEKTITIYNNATVIPSPTRLIRYFPVGDGVTFGDDYFITEDIITILSAIFANANTNFTLETDFDQNYSKFGEIEDLEYTPIYDYLQKLSGQFNWSLWDVSTTDTDVVKIADNFESTGLTLTQVDIKDYDSIFKMNVDDRNLAERIIVVGDDGLVVVHEDGTDYNVEANNTLGDREVIYRDNELYTKKTIEAFATSKHVLHSKISYSCEITLDYETPNQNYSTIAVGKTISLNVNEYPLYSAIAEDNEELFIEAITLRRLEEEGYDQFVTLHLMRRIV